MKHLITLILFFTTSCSTLIGRTVEPKDVADFADTAVMITNLDENSGGSGVVYESWWGGSLILTNRHVCLLTEHGGLVHKDGQKYLVQAIKPSKVHDVCFIQIGKNLGVSTKLASSAPDLYTPATISGHPHLLPHVASKGSWSGRMIIRIATGVRPCTEDDFKTNPLACIFMGGIPTVEKLEAQLVTALILPGSSGSAVFDQDGRIAGLAFASDSREMAYALVVPYEYVASFVQTESEQLDWRVVKDDEVKSEAVTKYFKIITDGIVLPPDVRRTLDSLFPSARVMPVIGE